ncbi:MAG: SPOR domain-containing protein [Microcoleaceae cyanobacterium]
MSQPNRQEDKTKDILKVKEKFYTVLCFMNRHSSVTSSPELSPTSLHPSLSAVMGTLDINLEKELTQYRRHRRRAEQWVPPSRRLTLQPPSQTVELITPTPEENTNASGGGEEKPSTLSITPAHSGGAIETSSAPKPATPESSPAPEKYLESSAELLKSLDESNTTTPREAASNDSLFTPLGIGSLSLFLLSCITLGYVIFYPSALPNFAFNRTSKPSQPPSNTPTPTPVNSPVINSPASLSKPNLVNKEFVQLDLSTLSNVGRRITPSPTPLVNASAPPSVAPIAPGNFANPGSNAASQSQGLNNLGKALLSSPSPSGVSVSPSPKASLIAQSPKPSIPPAGKPIKAQDGYYYVVIDFNGISSLEQTRKAVPDAYVRDFPNGVKIQVGALDRPGDAERLVKELQDKGIPAKHYQP